MEKRFDFQKIKENIKNFRFDKPTLKKLLPFFLELILLAFIITFDLCMKDYLVKFLSKCTNMSYVVIDGFFDLYYSENTGAGFGMFKDGTQALTIVTAIVIAAVCLYLLVFHSDSEWLRIPLVMIVGGGIGNLVDRISLGYVRDFFEFTFVDFAIFNVADAFVTVGSIWLVIYLIVMLVKDSKKSKKAEESTENNENADVTDNTADAIDNTDSADRTADGTESTNAAKYEITAENVDANALDTANIAVANNYSINAENSNTAENGSNVETAKDNNNSVDTNYDVSADDSKNADGENGSDEADK